MTPVEFDWNSAGIAERFFSGSLKIVEPEITTQAVNMSTTQEPKESNINVTKVQLQNIENKLVGKILAPKSYFMDEILSLNDQIKAYKINDNV